VSLLSLPFQRGGSCWPDGITPGFVELASAPTAGGGFAAPIGSIAKVGSTYYQKTGAGATAWGTVGAATLVETGGPTTLTMGAVADGEFLKRSGSSIVGGTAGGNLETPWYDLSVLGQKASYNQTAIGSPYRTVGIWFQPLKDCVCTGAKIYIQSGGGNRSVTLRLDEINSPGGTPSAGTAMASGNVNVLNSSNAFFTVTWSAAQNLTAFRTYGLGWYEDSGYYFSLLTTVVAAIPAVPFDAGPWVVYQSVSRYSAGNACPLTSHATEKYAVFPIVTDVAPT
jgi:hypothetical protein